MKSNELKIGNRVLVDYDEYIVNSISNSLCELLTINDNDPHQVHIGNIQPIPLTPEILEKCGLEKEHEHKFRLPVNDDCSLVCSNGSWYIQTYSDIVKLNIEYLHQLQNTFYILHGKCLKIEL